MEYRKLGKHGIRLSELSLGSWITFGAELDLNGAKECMKYAFDLGINFFDNAEVYGNGVSELLMGEALKMFPREEVVVSTKIFWGGKSVNSTGLSWKHLVEGTKASLKRLELEYVDLLFCHRPDPKTPIEETVRAMNHIIQAGHAFYWGTSEWTCSQIEEAHQIATLNHLIGPSMEQPQYNLFSRYRVEREYLPLYENYGMGTTTWSPLDSGILTGKYNEKIPPGSRLHTHNWLKEHLSAFKVEKVKKLQKIAETMGCSSAQLALAWCLKNPNVSTVILGASQVSQIEHNLKAIQVKHELTEAVLKEINTIFSCEAE
jgi:voltage-dependent potassium channel beta subunit